MSYIATMYLNCHSYYSLRYGTLSPQDIVNQAVALGIDRVALTDINNTSGVFEFYRACKQAGITPVVGIEFPQENQIRYIGIAQNSERIPGTDDSAICPSDEWSCDPPDSSSLEKRDCDLYYSAQTHFRF